jgi:hypothetical protein
MFLQYICIKQQKEFKYLLKTCVNQLIYPKQRTGNVLVPNNNKRTKISLFVCLFPWSFIRFVHRSVVRSYIRLYMV